MTKAFDQLRSTRNNIIKILDSHTLEALNKIPDGFNNNTIWHAGHVLVTQQRLIYSLSKLTTNIDPEMMDRYKKGSRPEGDVDQAEVDLIKTMLMSNGHQCQTDYMEGRFTEFHEYPTSYGIVLKDLADAITFNNLHEALHLGYMMAMRKNII